MVRRRARVGIAVVVETPRPSATSRQTRLPTSESGGDADDEADGREGGGLPGDGGAYLSAVEAEGFEQGEVAAAAADGGDERVADGEERESGEEGGEGGGEPVDLAEAVDFGGDGACGGVAEVGVGGDAMLDRGAVGTGREADEEVAAGRLLASKIALRGPRR